ncbi:MAG: hypothetical protein ACXITV_06395 [Luteibaculaceae bacterium]
MPTGLKNICLLALTFIVAFLNANAQQVTVKEITSTEVIQILKNHKGTNNAYFFTADWCGGGKLTFKNAIVKNFKNYQNQVFIFGSSDEFLPLIPKEVTCTIYVVKTNFSNSFSQKYVMRKILLSVDAAFEYRFQFPVNVKVENKKLIEL